MSLTSHLRDTKSPVRRFVHEEFPDASQTARLANSAVLAKPAVMPAGQINYSLSGTSIDYRIRYEFKVTAVDKLVAYRGANMLLSGKSRHEFVAWHRDPDLVAELHQDARMSPRLITGFFTHLERFVLAVGLPGAALSKANEDELDRCCLILGCFEQFFREGVDVIWPSSILAGAGDSTSVDELLGLVPSPWVEDLGALAAGFRRSLGSRRVMNAICNPSFEGSRHVGGADADLILDGKLCEIKTTIRSSIDSSALIQLVAYALLDYENEYDLTAVGLYMTRQERWIDWDLDSFLKLMSGRSKVDVRDLRRRFKEMVQSQPVVFGPRAPRRP